MSDPLEEAQERAILAAKSSNIAQMEDALAAEIPINTADPYGNTLLILAAQQGSRVGSIPLSNCCRILKFLFFCSACASFCCAEEQKSISRISPATLCCISVMSRDKQTWQNISSQRYLAILALQSRITDNHA